MRAAGRFGAAAVSGESGSGGALAAGIAGSDRAFLAGEVVACLCRSPAFRLALSPRFIEAAAALTIAYLAFEILLLPQSGQRWLVVGALGLFHGAYFSLFLVTTGYHLAAFLPGVIAAELVLLRVFYAGRRYANARLMAVMATLLLQPEWFGLRCACGARSAYGAFMRKLPVMPSMVNCAERGRAAGADQRGIQSSAGR